MPTGLKTCKHCSSDNYPAAKQCKDCNEQFTPKEYKYTPEQTKTDTDSQMIIQQCFPPRYSYLGSHKFKNPQHDDNGVEVYMGQSPDGTVFQKSTLSLLVAAAWNHCLKKTKLG